MLGLPALAQVFGGVINFTLAHPLVNGVYGGHAGFGAIVAAGVNEAEQVSLECVLGDKIMHKNTEAMVCLAAAKKCAELFDGPADNDAAVVSWGVEHDFPGPSAEAWLVLVGHCKEPDAFGKKAVRTKTECGTGSQRRDGCFEYMRLIGVFAKRTRSHNALCNRTEWLKLMAGDAIELADELSSVNAHELLGILRPHLRDMQRRAESFGPHTGFEPPADSPDIFDGCLM